MTIDRKSIIEPNPVIGALPAPKRDMLISAAILRRFRRDEMIVCAGEVWPYLFALTKGRIDACKESSEGRCLVVTTFLPGNIFWGLAFFYDNAPMPVTLRTRAATEIMLWSREQFLPFLKEHGAMSWELTRLMVDKMTRASEILEEMTFQPVAGRLAKLLLETAAADSSRPITRSLTLDEMAARIGSTREVVCRFLHRFADDGIIDITRTEYRIADHQQLNDLINRPRR